MGFVGVFYKMKTIPFLYSPFLSGFCFVLLCNDVIRLFKLTFLPSGPTGFLLLSSQAVNTLCVFYFCHVCYFDILLTPESNMLTSE